MWRYAARAVAALIVVAGAILVVMPRTVTMVAPALVTPRGLLAVAALRIVVGVILLGAARGSRDPRVVQVVGVIIIVAGLATPFFGVVRARAMMSWWFARGDGAIRGTGAAAMLIGGLLAYFVSEVPIRPGRHLQR